MGSVSVKPEAASHSIGMLRTAMGAITSWLDDPTIVVVMLNLDGWLWIDRLAGGFLIGNFNGPAIINPGIWLQLAVLLVAFVVVVGSFFVLAIQLFVTLIEFKLATLAGFVLVPFGLFGQTAFLAERVLGNVVASGVKILVLAVIVGIGTNLFSQPVEEAHA